MDTFRKWLNKPKADDKSLLARFYHADRALTAIASELDSFDGRAEPDRCSRLVSRLRQGQDKVLSITNLIMDQLLGDERVARGFRVKFPEEVLQENLAGQLWFGAECLAAGSSIMNRELESAAMRPLAQAVTKSLDNVRNLLREQCLRNNVPNSETLHLDINDSNTEQLYESLKIFDRLFAEFELKYVSAMTQVKSKHEYEMQEMICVLFSETLQRALKIGLLEQEQVDEFDPPLMFSIPRLAIICGLIIYPDGPLNMDVPADKLSEMFRPFRIILIKIRDLLRNLNHSELYNLEKLLCTNEDKNNLNINRNHTNPANAPLDSTDKVAGLVTEDNNDDIGICINNNVYNKHRHKHYKSRYSSISTSPESSPTSSSPSLPIDTSSDDDWSDDEEDENDEKMMKLRNENGAVGYLMANTNLGNLFQTTDGPLADNFIPCTAATSNTDDAEHESSQATGCDVLTTTPTEENSISSSEFQKSIQQRHLRLDRNSHLKLISITGGSSSSTNSDNQIVGESSGSFRKTPKRRLRTKSLNTNNNNSVSTTSSISLSYRDHSENRCPDNSGRFSKSSGDEGIVDININLTTNSRLTFQNTENLLHRLFVCIAGVADQLQTNFASDLRQILRSVFLMNVSSTPDENQPDPETLNTKETELYEFLASENDVVQGDGSSDSNQNIYSAEEVNPELHQIFRQDDEDDSEHQNTDNGNNINSEIESVITLPQGKNSSPSSSSSSSDSSSPNYNSDARNSGSSGRSDTVVSSQSQSPPIWIPDEAAPTCMGCRTQFTAFRRRHHCRNCGRVFCGNCSNSTAPLPKYGLNKAVRVCRQCYISETNSL